MATVHIDQTVYPPASEPQHVDATVEVYRVDVAAKPTYYSVYLDDSLVGYVSRRLAGHSSWVFEPQDANRSPVGWPTAGGRPWASARRDDAIAVLLAAEGGGPFGP